MWASGVTSLGLASFIQLYMGGLENGSLDVGVDSNPILNILSKITLKGRFGAAPAFFVFSWLVFSGAYFIFATLNGQIVGSGLKANEFEIRPVSKIIDDPSNAAEVYFQVIYNGKNIGQFSRTEAVEELRRLASDTSGEDGKGNLLTRKLLRDCAYNKETCQQPEFGEVKVSFVNNLGPGNAYACKGSYILASSKIMPGVRVLTSTTGNPEDSRPPIKLRSITEFEGRASKCKDYPNWIQIDSNYIASLDPAKADGFTTAIIERTDR